MIFAASLSGLNSASTAIDAIGNNISNLQTVGFKTSQVRFADVLVAAVPGAPQANVASAGVSTNIVRRSDQGVLAQTDNPLNMGISGNGFFRMDKGGEITYSRDGRFQLGYDSNSLNTRFVVDPQGRAVTGYLADYSTDALGTIANTAAPQPISFSADMPASATSKVSIAANLQPLASAPPVSPFDPTNAQTYSDTTGVKVWDVTNSTAASHDLNMYFVKSSSGNLWQLYTTLDNGLPTGPVDLNFDANGTMTTAMPLAAQTYAVSGGGNLSITLDLGNSTQYGNAFSVDSMTQNGYPGGSIESGNAFSVGSDGVIQATYSNGKTRKVGQVVLANFLNPDALIGIGDSQWKANDDPVSGTGKVSLDTPGRTTGTGALGLGSVKGSSVEQSNVDLNAELVSLIEQQRNYQASAQTFKILDQVLQNLTNLTK